MKEEPIDVVTDDDIIEHNLRYLEDHPEVKAQLLKRLKKPVKHTSMLAAIGPTEASIDWLRRQYEKQG